MRIRPREIPKKNISGATAVSWLRGNYNLVMNKRMAAMLPKVPSIIKQNFLGVRECFCCYSAELPVRYNHSCWICIKLCTNKEKDSTIQPITLFDASVICQYVSFKINGDLITKIMLTQKLKPRDITISPQLARKRYKFLWRLREETLFIIPDGFEGGETWRWLLSAFDWSSSSHPDVASWLSDFVSFAAYVRIVALPVAIFNVRRVTFPTDIALTT